MFILVIYCDDGKFIVQSAMQHTWMAYFQLPEEMRPQLVNSFGKRAFKFFKRANSPDQAIMMAGLKFFIIDFNIDTYGFTSMKELDLSYLQDKFPSTDFSRIRDCQVLDEKRGYGFVSWKSSLNNNQAWLEFFYEDPEKRAYASYDQVSLNVAPDLVRESDNQILFVNHHFEFKKDSEYVWFNYLDEEYNLISIDLKLPRNIHGQFDKAVIGEQTIIELNAGGIKSKPNRFARCGTLVVASFKEDNALVVKDVESL